MMHRLEVGMNNRKLMFSLAALVVAGGMLRRRAGAAVASPVP